MIHTNYLHLASIPFLDEIQGKQYLMNEDCYYRLFSWMAYVYEMQT